MVRTFVLGNVQGTMCVYRRILPESPPVHQQPHSYPPNSSSISLLQMRRPTGEPRLPPAAVQPTRIHSSASKGSARIAAELQGCYPGARLLPREPLQPPHHSGIPELPPMSVPPVHGDMDGTATEGAMRLCFDSVEGVRWSRMWR